jgi:hypothetical protein
VLRLLTSATTDLFALAAQLPGLRTLESLRNGVRERRIHQVETGRR